MPKGFDRVTEQSYQKRRMIMRIGALEKMGKSHWALTAPGPLGVLIMDWGMEDVITKFASDKIIYARSFWDMPSATKDDHQRKWEATHESYLELLSDKEVRSIIVDTDSEWWEIVRLYYLGRLTQVKPHHYAEVNAVFRGLIDAAFMSDKNLILVSRYKRQYVQKNPEKDERAWNGKYDAAGFNELAYMVQVNMRSRLAPNEDGDMIPSVEIINCRQNMAMTGMVFDGDEACFSWVAANIIEGTSPEEWE